MASNSARGVLGNSRIGRALGKTARVVGFVALTEALASVLLYAVLVVEYVAEGNDLPAVGEMARQFYGLRMGSEPLMAIDLISYALTADTYALQLLMFGVYLALIYAVAGVVVYYATSRALAYLTAGSEVNDAE